MLHIVLSDSTTIFVDLNRNVVYTINETQPQIKKVYIFILSKYSGNQFDDTAWLRFIWMNLKGLDYKNEIFGIIDTINYTIILRQKFG